MTLYRLQRPDNLVAPVMIAAFDSWIDAGGAASTAAEHLADDGPAIADFEGDVLFDYRSRRPTLEIVDGRIAELTWPTVALRHRRIGGRDVLVLSGAEPDFHWREFAAAVVEIARQLDVTLWISLGAIPAATPHTRSTNVLGSTSRSGLLLGKVQPGPAGVLRVPAACISVLEHAIGAAGFPAVGYYAQVPHYISGPYPAAAVELIRAVERHLDVELPIASLTEEAKELRSRLDAATALEETTRTYVERLEAMVDEERLPSGDDLISEIEQFLRDRGGEGRERT
ncbi:MAG TPA: PAC2 family protein [Candidatus Limnocylindrales bacterium]|nr:PAC2 family protein [Candidatus Limnocylindrales bacterium]